MSKEAFRELCKAPRDRKPQLMIIDRSILLNSEDRVCPLGGGCWEYSGSSGYLNGFETLSYREMASNITIAVHYFNIFAWSLCRDKEGYEVLR